MIRRLVRYADQRSGGTPVVRRALRYVFPDHWSFLLGEVALYAFVVLVATGTYLTLFYEDSASVVVYHGAYAPLHGQEMTAAYRSVLDLSTTVKAGLLIRQTHHWAANVFIVSILLHLLRVFFTGAYRKPREVTYWLGLTMLALALLEGFLGYSLVDDLLSGMGLAIAYSVAMSLPVIGGNLASLVWDGPFPGSHAFFPRMYVAHVLLLPIVIGGLLAAHLLLVALRHHTQFRERGASERRLRGTPAYPGQVPRSLGLFLATAGVLVLLGGLVQINPIWLWGPFHTWTSTNGAQPDWYLGWLIGALRLTPGFDLTIGSYTIAGNPFWGGALLPGLVFAFLYAWPLLEARVSRDAAFHNLLDRPRDAPVRTAIGTAMFVAIAVVFLAGSADRVTVLLYLSYDGQIWLYRVLFVVAPPLAALVTHRVCRELVIGEGVEAVRRQAIREARDARAAAAGPSPAPAGE